MECKFVPVRSGIVTIVVESTHALKSSSTIDIIDHVTQPSDSNTALLQVP